MSQYVKPLSFRSTKLIIKPSTGRRRAIYFKDSILVTSKLIELLFKEIVIIYKMSSSWKYVICSLIQFLYYQEAAQRKEHGDYVGLSISMLQRRKTSLTYESIWYSSVVKNSDPSVRLSGFNFRLYHLLVCDLGGYRSLCHFAHRIVMRIEYFILSKFSANLYIINQLNY